MGEVIPFPRPAPPPVVAVPTDRERLALMIAARMWLALLDQAEEASR